VEAAVLEVVLDAGSTDPPDGPVDHDDLPVVDVREVADVPARGAAGGDRLRRRPRLCGAHHPYLDASPKQAFVEVAARAVGVGALAVDDEPNLHAFGCFASSASANASPIAPGLNPNWLM
jgi:hypothetical protein